MDQTVLIVDDSQSYVPELRDILERGGYHVLNALRPEDALDMLKASPVDLVITEAVFPSIMDGFELVRQIRTHDAWANLPVIMLTVRNSPDDYTQGFSAGVNEYFVKPIDAPKLMGVVGGLIASRQAGRGSGGHAPHPAQVRTRSERGDVITLFSLKGGVGTSSIAVNLAVAIKRLTPSSRVGLIDLAFEQSIDALLLDIVPTSTILDWARGNIGDTTPQQLNQYFIQHRSGISLLAAPPSPEDAEMIRPDIVRRMFELAPQAFDYLIVDTASSFNEATLIALESSTEIVLPVTPDMASLKTAVTTLRILRAVKIDEHRVKFVLNEIIPRAGLTSEQVQTSLRQEPMAIPHAGALFMEAANQGMPLTTLEPPPPTARAIFDLARTLCEPEVMEVNPAKTQDPLRSVFGRLRRSQS